MGQIHYRKLLPTVGLATYIGLIWFGCPYRQTWESMFGSSDPTGFNLAWIDGPLSPMEQLAAGINFPIVMVLMPVASLIEGDLVGSQRDLLEHLAVACTIPFFWFKIGRWLDSPRSIGVSHRRMILNWIGLVLLAILAIIVTSLFLVNPSEFLFLRICMLAWIGAGIWVLGTRTRTNILEKATDG